jgi:hypothetical protein
VTAGGNVRLFKQQEAAAAGGAIPWDNTYLMPNQVCLFPLATEDWLMMV